MGISSAKEFAAKEAGFTLIRSIELLQNQDLIPQTFNFEQLRLIHHYLFQDIYIWAGRPRAYDMRKNGDEFTPAKNLAKFESQVFSKVQEYCANITRPSAVLASKQLAKCLGLINIYYPFPEGNGRTQRIFISMLARKFSYDINWAAVHSWEIVETSKQVHTGNYLPLELLLKRIIFSYK